MKIIGTFSYDIDTKQLSLDCDNKHIFCVHNTLTLPVIVAQDQAECQLANGDKGLIALTLAFDNQHNGLLVFACENEVLSEHHKQLEALNGK